MKNKIIMDSLNILLNTKDPGGNIIISAKQLAETLTLAELKEVKNEAIKKGSLQIVLSLEQVGKQLKATELNGLLKVSDVELEKIVAINLKKGGLFILTAAHAAEKHSQPETKKKLLEGIMDKANQRAYEQYYRNQAVEIIDIYLKATKS